MLCPICVDFLTVRADRLLAIVLLLQTHGRVTVGQLAGRLEVTERTIRRDLDALSAAGVPVYSQRGRGGGWRLLGGHRIDLSALTSQEAEAVFLVAAAPAPAGLGIEGSLASALRKLLAALPEGTRQGAIGAQRAMHLDHTPWGRRAEEPPALLAHLRAAVVTALEVDLTYAKPGRPPDTRRVQPYGLVSKSGVWYLLAGTDAGVRTFRASRVVGVVATGDRAEVPPDLELGRAWREATEILADWPGGIGVELLVEAGAGDEVAAALGGWSRLHEVEGGGSGRRLVVRFPTAEAAARDLVGLRHRVRVVGPDEVREEMARIGRELVAAYGPPA